MAFSRSNHSVFECKYHFIWSTKYRRKLLTLPHEWEFCEQVLRRAAEEYGMQIEEIEGTCITCISTSASRRNGRWDQGWEF